MFVRYSRRVRGANEQPSCAFKRQRTAMPIFMDRHYIDGVTAAELAEAHQKDLEIQDQFGVKFITYWFDQARSTAFCLIDAPDIETAMLVHEKAHGKVAQQVIPVDLSAVEAFLGRISQPNSTAEHSNAAVDAGLRAVMFTDIVDSTGITQRLGDKKGLELVRAHDSMVRRALGDHTGREVKHTGDGIMASFASAASAVECGGAIQQSFHGFNAGSLEKLEVRIGIHAGEPVEDRNDLFGTTVQIAARICQITPPGSVVVSQSVRDIAGSQFAFAEMGHVHLKGIAKPVWLHKFNWRH
jgi:class 3 adenylate cyclase